MWKRAQSDVFQFWSNQQFKDSSFTVRNDDKKQQILTSKKVCAQMFHLKN